MMVQEFKQARNAKRTAAAILTEAEVRVIKTKLAEGMDRRDLANIYQVAKETIARIDRGDTWGWVKAQGAITQSELDEQIMLATPLTEEEKAKVAASQAKLFAMLKDHKPVAESTEDEERDKRIAARYAAEAEKYLKPGKALDEFIKPLDKPEEKS